MRVFILIALLLCVSCTSIDVQGNHCHKDKNKNCEIYMPFYTPAKLFVKSALN